LGAAEVSAQAAALEAVGKAGDVTAVRENLPGFTARLAELVEGIERALGNGEGAVRNEDGAGNSASRALLGELAAALEAQKADDIEGLLEALSRQETDPAVKEALERAADSVLMAEYGKALEELRAISLESVENRDVENRKLLIF
jgi:hypothetical protein